MSGSRSGYPLTASAQPQPGPGQRVQQPGPDHGDPALHLLPHTGHRGLVQQVRPVPAQVSDNYKSVSRLFIFTFILLYM